MIAPFVRIAHSVVYRINPVLPQAYDDSLSYFEVLARLQKKINELIDAVNALEDAVEELDTRLTTVENKIEEIIENVNSIDDRVKYLEEHPYVLPIATDTVLGGVKIGEGITRQADGTISVEGGSSPYVLPTMDEDTKGGARLGEGLVITDTDKLNVDADNLDLSNNSSIVNIENNIDEIENNIEALDTDITNIISGDTPVPSSYVLPTMNEDTKGGAKLGDGLLVDGDTLSVDSDNLDLSNNETITNIIDGTTQIDISENESITNIEGDINDIINGDTPVPSSYELPTMSANTKGGAKVGKGLSVIGDVLSVDDTIVDNSNRFNTIYGAEDTGVSYGTPTYTFTPQKTTPSYTYHYLFAFMINDEPYMSCVSIKFNNPAYNASNYNLYISGAIRGDTGTPVITLCAIDNFGISAQTGSQSMVIGDYGVNTYKADGTLDGQSFGLLYSVGSGYTTRVAYLKEFTSADTFNLQPVINPISSNLGFNQVGKIYNSTNPIYAYRIDESRPTEAIIRSSLGFSFTLPNDIVFTGWDGINYSINENYNSIVELKNRVAANVPQSLEEDYPTVTEFNALLTALKNAGLMVADP